MPYFYKVSDIYLNNQINEQYLSDVEFFLCFLIEQCNKKSVPYKNTVKIFTLNLDGINNTQHGQLLFRKNRYEYYTNIGIPPGNIIDVSQFSFSEDDVYANNYNLRLKKNSLLVNYLIDANNYNNNNSFFIHMTCSSNYASIISRGLLSQNMPQNMKLSNVFNGGSKRKSPLKPAKEFKLNTIKIGLDGNKWIVKKRIDGVKIWKKITN